ncbi:MAG: NAD(P)/FAD-dependent oxidoreductase [Acidobacteriota bacterium]
MKTIDTDVLVVGAGPGGSMAAKFAARQGARTLLIEKRQEIGSPVRCAEGVSREWMAECEVSEDPRWIATRSDAARIFAPNGTSATIGAKRAGNEVGIVLERVLFDKALAEDAARAGADILLKTFATNVLIDNGVVRGVVGKSLGEDVEIRAMVTIGADGFESQVGRWAGLRTMVKTRDVDATFQYRLANIRCDARYCDFYLGSCAPGGYIWVFPKSHEVANVGIGVQMSQLNGLADTKAYLDGWIASQPAFRNGKPLDMVAGAVSTSRPLPKTVTPGLMLVGDAARLIDPLTGGGIVNACISGKLAGDVAARAWQARDASETFLQSYDRAWRSRMEKKQIRNYLAKEKLAHLDDETLNTLIGSLSTLDTDASTMSLLLAIGKKHPRFIAEFAHLLWKT